MSAIGMELYPSKVKKKVEVNEERWDMLDAWLHQMSFYPLRDRTLTMKIYGYDVKIDSSLGVDECRVTEGDTQWMLFKGENDGFY